MADDEQQVIRTPGFRFFPTEEELICFYLRNKLDGVRCTDIERVIPVADVCALDPRHLPEAHCGSHSAANAEPWFYVCPRQQREARGGRPSRTTPLGYWKAAGTARLVHAADGRSIATKKTMVFYIGRAPAGGKTSWNNEYKALVHSDASAAPSHHILLQTRTEFSLCRLYTKSGCLRQFDRRPTGAASMAGGGAANEDPIPPSAATAAAELAGGEASSAGHERRRAAAAAPANDDDGNPASMSNAGDGGRSTQPLSQLGGGIHDEAGLLADHDMADWWSQLLVDDWGI